MKKYILPIGVALLLILAGCGTSGKQPVSLGQAPKVQDQESEREIIAELKQTATETPERNQVKQEITEQPEFKDGLHGKPSESLLELLTVQQVEGEAALQAIDQVYGLEEFREEGILFYGDESNLGFWIGLKKPDERLNQIVDILQKKVDRGEILAKYIHFFKNDFTEAEQRTLTDQVAKALKQYVVNHYNPDAVSYSASVDTLTGNIQIGHNFLENEQMEQLKETFAGYNIVFTQEGRMIPKEGEPDVKYPEEEYTAQPIEEGSIIVSVGDGRFLTDWTYFEFKGAEKKLKAGQRVIVAAAGGIMESMPAQGRASFVELLPDYKPDGADLSESIIALKAISEAEKKSNFAPNIGSITYNSEKDEWTVSISQDEDYELTFKDE
ncbi:DUF3221 domain-containing protein [Chungangia koreensis]|uniref:DUF3221 domain-containing protein n=1 Tax=Chungangia koreensis TaxID=752657 RepID=A0ABV8X4I2_9LACT